MKRKIGSARGWFAGLLLLGVVLSGNGCATDDEPEPDDRPSNPNAQARPGQYPRPKIGTVTPVDPP